MEHKHNIRPSNINLTALPYTEWRTPNQLLENINAYCMDTYGATPSNYGLSISITDIAWEGDYE